MPERPHDNKMKWEYAAVMPSMDGKLNPHTVSRPNLVEAVGFDGRFVGAIRPFPGMADDTVHGVPTPTAGVTTIESISNVVLVKYVSIQKGTSGDVLKGLAILADNPGGTGKSLYFAYRDSSDGSTDVIELEDYDTWDDFKLTSYDEYDITSLGRYIYVCISGDTVSNVTQWQSKEPPYNKAYFWDYKLNDWDKFVVGMDHRFMGLMPRRLLGHPLNEEDDGTYLGDSEDSFATQVYGPIGHSTPAGDYTYGVELISRKHGLRSYLRYHSESALGTPNSGLLYFVDEVNLPVDQGTTSHQIKGNAHERTCIINWGIPHVDGFRLWATTVDDNGAYFDKYTPFSPLHLVDDYIEKGVYQTTSGLLQFTFDHDSIIGTTFGSAKSTWFTDGGLVIQDQYSAFTHPFFPTPRFKRLIAYDGLLVGVTDVEEPASPDANWDDREKVPEALAWSTLIADEPENFPPDQQFRPDSAAERFYALELTGDYVFGITNASIYKMTRSGSTVVTNRLQFGLGGVSRFGQCGVGNSLFVVTPSGLKQINGSNGAINSVSALDRIILDDSEWAGSLADVRMEFDAKIGVLILLNTTKKEAYLLWEATGAVNKLEDVPWTHLTSGPDVLTDGAFRAYFVRDDGRVHVIDGAREMGKRSMCGTAAGETMNGTFTAGTTATTLIDSDATMPANCAGFTVHILSGDLVGESAVITTRDSDTQLTVPALSGIPAVGDRYSVSPVVSRAVLPVMWDIEGQPNPFIRKVGVSFQASYSDLGGHTETTDTNGKFRYGFRQMSTDLGSVEADFNVVPDKTVATLTRASTRLFPYLEWKGGNQDWELQAVVVHGLVSQSEAQSRQGTY